MVQETIRSSVSAVKTEWADELEPEILQKKENKIQGISDGLRLSSGVFIASSQKRSVPVYPSLEGFGSLDTAQIAEKPAEILNGFCNAVCTASPAESFVAEKRLSTLVFFFNDVKAVFPSADASFTSFFYGKPFDSGADYEVPVRLSGNGFYFDLLVYLNKDSDWKINQIQIKKRQVQNDAE